MTSCAGTAGAAPTVHVPLRIDVPRARGIVVLVHSGAWSGPNAGAQAALSAWPGTVLRRARWDTVSVDYPAGKAGLAAVRDELAAAIAAAPHHRACAYGESAGGHLALLAAASLPRLDCVMTLGAPTDFGAWRRDDVLDHNAIGLTVYAETAGPTFGLGPQERPWEPVTVAPEIAARVLLAGQADDQLMSSPGQLAAFMRVSPSTETLITPAGDFSDPHQRYLHGTLTTSARAMFERRLLAFVARARRPPAVATPPRWALPGLLTP